MDAFSYLSVLLSIILGLAITQILQGYRGLLLARGRVSFYAPSIIWSALLLVLAAQNWWSSFGLAQHHNWTFLAFGGVLLQTVVLYMMAGLVLPDMPAGEPIDLRAHFYREQRPFFSLFIVMLAASVGKDWLLDRQLPAPTNLAFHAAFALGSLSGLLIRRPRFHEIAAPLVAISVFIYIGLLFARL